MNFTGERMIPESNKGEEIYFEHMNRYFFASQFVKNKIVLDIASGSGYGSKMLLDAGAKSVFGVDISEESIKYCKDNYKDKNIEFVQGSIEKIPLSNESVDIIISFETIEHVDEIIQIEFLKEIKRILKPEGLFVVSTPNSLVYPEGNKFHLKELSPKEFENLLKDAFREVSLFYQNNIGSNYIFSEKQKSNNILNPDLKIETKKLENIDKARSLYLIALCSNNKIKKELISEYGCFFNVSLFDLHTNYQGVINNRNSEIKNLNLTLKEKDEVIKEKDEVIKEKDEVIKEKDDKTIEKEEELILIKSSKFWKLRNRYLKLKNFSIKEIQDITEESKRVIREKGIKRFLWCIPKYLVHGRDYFTGQDTPLIEDVSPDNYEILIQKDQNKNYKKIEKIVFKKQKNPKVSIIIPVFNKWRYTYNCLRSLNKNISGYSYEVVVVDNHSVDGTSNLFKNKIKNVIYIRNSKNLNFVGGCNQGSENSRGEYLLFLNNDTFVLPNWLESLVETFENNKNIGAVGSKLIYPDGRLQEAGGIVWKNQNAWNYGKGRDPKNYEFNYLKDVDYCSGASLMIKKEIFKELKGFDTLYQPAYFEDTDLNFRIRKLGLRTVYQPKSELIHFEGATAGTDLKKGTKKYQEVNKKKFFSRWKKILEKENKKDIGGNEFLARDRSQIKKVLLFVENTLPTYDKDAGSFITFEYLKLLSEMGYKIIFWPYDLCKSEPYVTVLQQMGIEVVYGNESFEQFIQKNGKFIDLSIVSRPNFSQFFINLIKLNSNSKILYMAHDLHFLREMRQAETEKTKKKFSNYLETKKIEIDIMKKSDTSLVFSEDEKNIVQKEFPKINVETIPWIQKSCDKERKSFEKREGLFFLGGFGHSPNVDAVIWFHDEVFPKIRKKIPNVVVNIAGSNPPEKVLRLNKKNFKIFGFVEDEDLPVFFERNRVFVAPLRFGAGFKGKIAMSMSYGLPVVTTLIGSEGMKLENEKNVLIGNSSYDFANQIIKLYSDSDLWSKLSQNSKEHIENNFSLKCAKNKFNSILKKL